MKAYEKAKKIEDNEKDAINWQLGIYFCRAISLYGKGKYPDKPLFQSDIKVKESNSEGRAVIERINFELRSKILKDMGFPMPPH